MAPAKFQRRGAPSQLAGLCGSWARRATGRKRQERQLEL